MITNTPGVGDLLELLADSKRGYQEAAERIGAVDAKELLQELSTQRAQLIEELERLLQASGEAIPGADTVKEDPESDWSALRHALSQAPKENLLHECARSESFLADRYDETLDDAAIPDPVKDVVRPQYEHLRNNLARLAALQSGNPIAPPGDGT